MNKLSLLGASLLASVSVTFAADSVVVFNEINYNPLAGQAEFIVQLGSAAAATTQWQQKPQKYHARSLAILRNRYAQARSPALDAVLDAAGATRWLAS